VPSGKDHLESDIQHRIIDRARTRGCYVRKIVSIAYRGMPDLLLVRGGCALLWEVKRTGGTATKLQQLEHNALRRAGANVVLTFGLADAFRELDNWFPENPEI
jgi:hypothetical protein